MMVMMSHMLNPRRPTPRKDMPYESGMIPLGDTCRPFSVKFYVVRFQNPAGDQAACFS